MANPSIALRRGEGWTNQGWRENKPILERARTKTLRSIAYLGITYRKPKVGTVHRFPTGEKLDDIAGRSFDERNYALYVETIDGGKLGAIKRSFEWAVMNLHEIVHCIREEDFPERTNDFIELTASEGVAHIVEDLDTRRFGGKQLVSNFFDRDLERPDPALLQGFNDILRNPDRQFDYFAHDQWFEGRTGNVFLRDGALLGSQLIVQQLKRGLDIAELVHMPAEEALGLQLAA